MKKQIFAGIVILLVMFFVTCDDFIPLPFGPSEEKVEYTDVEYSEDGSAITVYLDGIGVPVTKAQRAITRDLAKMAYDYFEVVFVGKTPGSSQVVARSQWELGQSAGISGVERDVDYRWDPANNYVTTPPPAAATDVANVALMFVGRKDDKTLLGVGQIAEVDHSARLVTSTPPKDWDEAKDANAVYTAWAGGMDPSGSGLPATIYAYISSKSTSITFYVEAIKTGLLIGDELVQTNPLTDPIPDGSKINKLGILTDSFNFTGDGDDPTPTTPASAGTTGYKSRLGVSKRQNPGNGNTDYPIYSLPEDPKSVQLATYTFKGAAVKNNTSPISFANGIKYFGEPVASDGKAGNGIAIERRFPRYLVGGRYLQLKENVDTDTTVELDVTATGYTASIPAGSSLNPVVPLKFTTKGNGVFSFYIEIPVFMLTPLKGTNSGELQPITWKLRTGLGSELYSLDSGKSSGGCVLMGIGDIDLDWLEIYWEWLK